ncbi:hybrid non-ribosomal peptide synthetase/type I polyketide synthase [Chitinimonas sp. BJB300]|uniref:hybrid non-ribosomal peptide synthetase/type I polyketide synthase n=1 Tax=Chitinimonas sp. BJB300 TaxID=1559339 RepID=UPI000C113857|nr:hybrid non-ribosomal peptide synthetase/type I polyketide synthase [Chitinimonas sp. BJB300]PHV12096.1 hypothetical protein CSQ89_07490 [Chitinimonas sp. BJB300]TSJ87513.1 hybrid non-ribosomal peptide synthetase/type I polyketide synthase [Chitinimonas sp. BJB300]
MSTQELGIVASAVDAANSEVFLCNTSAAQQRLWLVCELEPDNTNYTIAGTLHLTGQLQPDLLQLALNDCLARHESLRTGFVEMDGNPMQAIEPSVTLVLDVIDLGDMPTVDKLAHAHQAAEALAHQPFNLSQPPLLRVALFKLGQDNWLLALAIHHIICDGPSLGLLMTDLAQAYSHRIDPRQPRLDDLELQFADFAEWQLEQLAKPETETLLAAWETQLVGVPDLDLPTDYQRPSLRAAKGARHYFDLPPTTHRAAGEVGRELGATPFTVLLAAWGMTLASWSAQDDFAIGTPVSARNDPALAGIVGLFAETAALRFRVVGNPTVGDTLQAVRDVWRDSLAYAGAPFDRLVQRLKRPHDRSRTPLIQTLFSLNTAETAIDMAGLTVLPSPLRSGEAKADLVLEVTDSAQGYTATLDYDSALFHPDTIAWVAERFGEMLTAATGEQTQSLRALFAGRSPLHAQAQARLANDIEKSRLLSDLNNTRQDLPVEQLLHRLLEIQVASTPHAPAFQYKSETLTFDALNSRANQLAHYLRSLGVQPDQRVALCCERGISQVVGLWAILKAGGAYVPLDPTYPAERLTYMLSDSAAVALLTEATILPRFNLGTLPSLCLDAPASTALLATQSDHNLDPADVGLHASHLAYVIYTSGSTGQPKGVMVEHRSVTNLWVGLKPLLAGLPPQAKVGLNASISFDASLQSLLQLLSGHCLVQIPQALRADGAALLDFLTTHQIHAFDCTPGVMDLLLAAGFASTSPYRPECVLVGGESISPYSWRTLRNVVGTRIHNVYGPTECTVDATSCTLHEAGDTPVIGRPLANTQIYILDAQSQLLSPGEVGEIHIGGAGVARGYLNRPELTAAKFIVDPFATNATARLYRSGDLGRWLPDGSLEYLGRSDKQVKLRGQRIELGEIERNLCRCTGVRDAVVLAREDIAGDKRLVAYLLAKSGTTLSATVLRNELTTMLTDTMVPSAFVCLDAFPMTSNGKLDWRALPPPNLDAFAMHTFEAPQNEVEQRIAELWQTLLGVPQVGRQDDFFALGGHSLLATRVASRLGKHFGIRLPMSTLFDHPVLAALGAHIDTVVAAANIPPRVAKATAPIAAQTLPAFTATSPIPLSASQLGLWFIQQLDPSSTAYVLSGALRIRGPLKRSVLSNTLDLLQRRHQVLRTAFYEIEGIAQQRVIEPIGIPLPVVDLRQVDTARQEAELRSCIDSEACQPFDLTQAPLLRAKLLVLGSDHHVLSLTLHHIIADGWSFGILWRELVHIYTALRTNSAPEFEPALQYAAFAHAETVQRDEGANTADQTYWVGALADLPVLALPTDYPRPSQSANPAGHLRFDIPASLCAQIDQLARSVGASRFMVMMAAFQVLLARWSNQRDFAVGVPVSGRDVLETHDVVGCFVNTVVIRAELDGEPDFRTLLERVKARCLNAFAHQTMPFKRLVDTLRPAHDLSRHPLFQVLFNYQHTDFHQHNWDGLQVETLVVESNTAQFDLGLYAEENPDGLSAQLVYRSDLFKAGTAERMAAAFLRLLGDAGTPECSLFRTSLLRDLDREMLAAWNNTTVDFGPATTIDALIAAQVARTPLHCAVEAEDGRLTFTELLARADALAAQLMQHGAGPGRIVAVHLQRGVDLPVALVAVLRSGAAYLPLDPDLPNERLAFMVEDAAPVAIIAHADTTSWLTTTLPVLTPVVAISPLTAPMPVRNPQNVAYVIYTSGSTGRPKGVMVPHAGAVNRLLWMQSAFPQDSHSKILQKTSASFDVSVWEFFWPLISGATLVMARPGGQRDPDYLCELIERAGITTLHFVPSMLDMFLADAKPSRCASLRHVFTSGEALSPELRDRFFDRGFNAQLVNLYGPTEASVEVTCSYCNLIERGQPQPIGHPIANCRIHVVDELGQEVPIGVPGEICIAGVQVAQGYLNRPELSAERFVADTFNPQAGALLYRTGDTGRWRDDGEIEYIGRRDNQIKLRGHRIELGEIESALRQHPQIREAVVLVQGAQAETRRLVAFLLIETDATVDIAELRRQLATCLPEAMVPSVFQPCAHFPLTSSGKTDRRALLGHLPQNAGQASSASSNDVERQIAAIWCEVLEIPSIDTHSNFFEVGGNSLLLMRVQARIKQLFDPAPRLIDLFRFPTVATLATHIEQANTSQSNQASAAAHQEDSEKDTAIAIIGMSGRFPGAADVETLWRNLLASQTGISEISRETSLEDGADPALLDHTGYVPYAGTLEGIDQFDERLFNYSPADAALIDPQGRLFLECAWEALETAGIDPARTSGPIGVYAGGSISSYVLSALRGPAVADTELFRVLFANDKDYLASRVAYKLGLHGPAVGVQTACSTSMVAVALAVRALQSNECDVVLAGGSSISIPHNVGYLYEEGSIMSPDGHCRAFSHDAAGTVPGNGVGVVVLKRLSQALADGDPIRAVIRGMAINNDGADKVGFSAPSIGGQEAVLQTALRKAGITATDIGYVETHGTGTRLGDEVELTALTGAFSTADEGQRCLIGSLKSSIGHLDAAAGIAGLIKTALIVERGLIPASLNVAQPNALLCQEPKRFQVVTETTAWPDNGQPRRAGVSAFGIGGTNAHCIVEQPPTLNEATAEKRPQLLLLSANDAAALERYRHKLADALSSDDVDLAAIAWTLQSGRRELSWRLAIVAKEPAEAKHVLLAAPLPSLATSSRRPRLYFAFPGQGSQRAGMGSALYANEPIFRQVVDTCLAALPAELANYVRTSTFAKPGDADQEALLARTDIAQPALFILEYALAQLLTSWDIHPTGLVGHSLGEITAAAVAGMLSPAEALRLVVLRGRLMHESAKGAMLQVETAAATLAALLPETLAIAALNAPELTVVTGTVAEVEQFTITLDQHGIVWQRLRSNYAFHSPLMEPAAAQLRPLLATLSLQTPKLPILSNLSGDWMSESEALDAGRWARQLCAPVQFAPAIAQLDQADTLVLEVGPGTTLAGFARFAGIPALSMLGRIGHEASDTAWLATLGKLWQAGLTPKWQALHHVHPPRRIVLPTYPFARNRHWLAAPAGQPKHTASLPTLAMLDWRYAEPALPHTGLHVALYGETGSTLDGLTTQLAAAGATVLDWDGLLTPPAADRLIVLNPAFDPLLILAKRLAGQHRGKLLVVTTNAQEADADTDAEAARVAAAVPSIGQELPELQLRQIDLSGPINRRQLIALAAECLTDGPASVVLRDGRRRLPTIESLTLTDAASPWQEGDVTLITGAFGNVGMAFAHHLAAQPRSRLVLLGRHAPTQDDPRLQSLRALGAKVLVLAGDICIDGVASSTVRAALQHFGRLDCVVHAAGIAGEMAHQPVLEYDPETCARIQVAKLSGTVQLAAALNGVAVRHVLLCSSISTVLGGLGFAAYAAGNRWMEVFAEQQARDSGVQWLALAYDGWHFDGQPSTQHALSATTAIALSMQAMAAGLSGRVLVSAGELPTRLARWCAYANDATDALPEQHPIISGYDDPLEAMVAQAIADTLALAAIGPNDDFFSLGGDSLVATRVIARLRGATSLPLSVGLVLQAPTVRLLAAAIRAMQGSPTPDADENTDEYEEGTL